MTCTDEIIGRNNPEDPQVISRILFSSGTPCCSAASTHWPTSSTAPAGPTCPASPRTRTAQAAPRQAK
jgi:hypothetical protein